MVKNLVKLLHGLDSRDFGEFADLVADLYPVLGETVRLHADAADGNSPDLVDWPQHTADDAVAMAAAGVDTQEAARAWWLNRYS